VVEEVKKKEEEGDVGELNADDVFPDGLLVPDGYIPAEWWVCPTVVHGAVFHR